MAGYTKLFSSILASTIWREDDKTRIVWITLLAMADKNGVAEGSLPGLADFARVSMEDCKAALEKLSSPDTYSRSKDYEGRRIESVDGGWRILNHGKYRAKMGADERRAYEAEKKRQQRAKAKMSTNVPDSQRPSQMSLHTEAEASPYPKEEEKQNHDSSLLYSEDDLVDAILFETGNVVAEVPPNGRELARQAIKNILVACPDLTPHEITRRAGRCRVMNKGMTITPKHLSTMWGMCGSN